MHCEECTNRKICSAPEKYNIAGCTAGHPEQEDLKVKENRRRVEYGAYFREKESRKYKLFGIGRSPEVAKKVGMKKVQMALPGKYDKTDSIIMQRTVVEIFDDWKLVEDDDTGKPEENSIVYFLKRKDKNGKKVYVPGKVCRYVLRGNEKILVVKESRSEKCGDEFQCGDTSRMNRKRKAIEDIYCFPASEIGKTIFSDDELNKIVDAMFAEDDDCHGDAAKDQCGLDCMNNDEKNVSGTDDISADTSENARIDDPTHGEENAETENVCTNVKRAEKDNSVGVDSPDVISYPEGVDSDIPSEPSEVEEVKRVSEAKAVIAKYMKEHGYKCSLGDLLRAYEKYKHGEYVSFSISPCMLACKDQLEILRSMTISALSEENKNHHDKL